MDHGCGQNVSKWMGVCMRSLNCDEMNASGTDRGGVTGYDRRATGRRHLAAARWLLAGAIAVCSAEAFAAASVKHVSAHQSKPAKVERHKHGSAVERKAAARHNARGRAAHAASKTRRPDERPVASENVPA